MKNSKIRIFVIIFIISGIALSFPSLYAQNTKDVGQPPPYVAFVELQIRNQDGVLTGVVVSDTIIYSESPSTDELLDKFSPVAIVENNGIRFEKIIITNEVTANEDTLYPKTNLYSIPKEKKIAFSSLHHAYVVDKDYTYFIKWTIYRPI